MLPLEGLYGATAVRGIAYGAIELWPEKTSFGVIRLWAIIDQQDGDPNENILLLTARIEASLPHLSPE
jgi:hypothetical protein